MTYHLSKRQADYLRAVKENELGQRLSHKELIVNGEGQKHWQKVINYLRKRNCINTSLNDWVIIFPNGEDSLKKYDFRHNFVED